MRMKVINVSDAAFSRQSRFPGARKAASQPSTASTEPADIDFTPPKPQVKPI
ncbi:hypothetical protein [Lentzea pudingi]|uniref:hypothetical protein n=1 Tax=Lentzea pudingi TaxID=1789439 RepID=UPI001664E2A5|nr:hypothetical protein [Lentzea pudingi]